MNARPKFDKAATAAADLLKRYGISAPPVDPERIAEEEGLRVVYADFEYPDSANVSGFFRLDELKIFVNREINANRITFTIAHELAHYILHRDFIASNDYMPMPRNNEYPNGKPVEEVEADTFAANLLVPLKMLREYEGFASLDELATVFFVSREVIANRFDLLRRYPSLGR